LAFSGDVDRNAAGRFRSLASRIIEEEGFSVNTDKTRLMGRGSRQTVTGVVVNHVLGLSRQERRRLRAMAHRLRGESSSEARPGLQAMLRGKLAYLSMLN